VLWLTAVEFRGGCRDRSRRAPIPPALNALAFDPASGAPAGGWGTGTARRTSISEPHLRAAAGAQAAAGRRDADAAEHGESDDRDGSQ
jgi:hypothetical protein